MTTIATEDALKEMEEHVLKLNGELSPSDLNILRDIETSTTDSKITNRVKEIRKKHDYWTTHYELPEDWESCTD